MALQYSPKIVTDSLVMCLDPSQNKSYPTTDLPVKGGLLLWLDAADDSTFSYSSGTVVSQWRDKSGNNFHASQSTTSQQPSRNTTNNSRKSVFFNASSRLDYMTISSGISLPTDASIFIVYKPSSQIYQYAVLIDNYHGQGGNYGFVIQRVSTNSQFYYANGNGSSFVDTSASPWAYTDGAIQLLSLNKLSSTATPYTSGTAQTSRTIHAATAQSTTGLAIGYWGYGGGRFYNGDMCEMLIFNRALSSTEMKQVHTYLGQKWGILNTDRSIIDLSGNNNHGLLGNGTTADMPAADYYNKGALKLDGTSDYIAVANNTSLNPATVTVSIWVKRNGYQSSVANYLRRNYNDAYGILGDIAADNVRFRIHNGSTYPESPNATLSLNEWTNIVGTYDLANIKIYKNGVFVGQTAHTSAISYASSNTTLTIGRDDPVEGRYMNANYGSVLIYSRALSAAEIAQNYEAQKSKFADTIVQQGLVLNLDAANPYSYAGAGTTWYDVSGNSYNGTLTNSPTYSSDNGGSLAFNGSNNYIVTSNFTPNITNKTLSGWVKLSSISQQGGGLINLQSTDGVSFDAIVYNETNNGWGFGSNGFSRTGWSGVKETSTNDWVNITATYENLNYRIYRNGVLIYTLTSFNTLNFNFSSNSLLGYRHLGGGSAFLAGNIAQGLIYNRALSAAEVLQNYNATKGRFGL